VNDKIWWVSYLVLESKDTLVFLLSSVSTSPLAGVAFDAWATVFIPQHGFVVPQTVSVLRFVVILVEEGADACSVGKWPCIYHS
jgi:hypothetical protein